MLSAEVFDKRFYDLLDLQQEPTVIAEGCVFTEGPIWDPNTQEFTFSDTRNGGRTYRWSKETGVRVIRAYSNAATGEAFDAQGRILQCEQFAHRVIRMNLDTTGYEVLAARFEGRELNSPNDVIVRNSTGIVYFTDPHFGRRPGGCGSCAPAAGHDGQKQRQRQNQGRSAFLPHKCCVRSCWAASNRALPAPSSSRW